MLTITAAAPADRDAALAIYAGARAFMAAHGNPTQWAGGYPPPAQVEADIAAGRLYLAREDGAVQGVFFFGPGPDPTYAHIEQGRWPDDEPYWVVHRIASAGLRRGVAGECLAWCCRQAGGRVRIDTHADNRPMQATLARAGFAPCGVIFTHDGTPRLAYQYAGGETAGI